MHMVYCSNVNCSHSYGYLDGPFYCYSGGGLAAGMIVTALLVGGISVAIHIAVYHWIYKPKMKPQSGVSVDGKTQDITKDGDSATYETVDEEAGGVPEMKQNKAYGRVSPEAVPEIRQNEAYEPVPKIKQNEAYSYCRGPHVAACVSELKKNACKA